MTQLQSILEKIKLSILEISDTKEIEKIKQEYLGKNGYIVSQMNLLKDLDQEQRKVVGKEINDFKIELLNIISQKTNQIELREINDKLRTEAIDVTLPPRYSYSGTIHPISKTIKDISDIFISMGFGIEEGPDIEDDFHNFTALNIDENHPARQMHDTFYVNDFAENVGVLRTHTSPVQIRKMMAGKPPFRFISPGRVYRCDSDTTHTPMFHQIEGVCIDKNIDMSHLKWCLETLVTRFFGKKVQMRFRPSFFPFTEPSAEVDILFDDSRQWLEVLGCGMVHPKVLQNVGVDSDKYQGFAFGLGIERFAMLKYNIKDLRTFFDCDIRWSQKFGCRFFEF
jgi:phenylalanyl-tRNA synthetase alpha chain